MIPCVMVYVEHQSIQHQSASAAASASPAAAALTQFNRTRRRRAPRTSGEGVGAAVETLEPRLLFGTGARYACGEDWCSNSAWGY